MNRTALRAASLLLVLPLSAWFVASAMAPARAQDPKPAPAPEGQDDPRPQGEPRGGERPGPRGEGRRFGRGGPGEGPGLHGAMEQMKGEMRRVSEGIADPAKNEVTLQGLGRMIQFAGAAQGGEPKEFAALAAEEKAAQKATFRRELALLAKDLSEIELLVLDGKNAEAAAALKAKVVAARDDAHKKYGVEED